MSETIAVAMVTVNEDEAGLRLDRWFRRRYPALSHGRLEKLLRTGQVRVDGKRAQAGERLSAGQQVRIPPLGSQPAGPAPSATSAAAADPRAAAALMASIVYRDQHVIALNKEPGLAVQGGSRTQIHVDGLLDALRFDAGERPRLVHRLDKDTSGLLVLGRSAAAAARLAAAFRERTTLKEYWAVVVGVPRVARGTIDLPLAKGTGGTFGRESMVVDEAGGDHAVTDYETIDVAGKKAALLVLRPLTGRTHQLRVHCAALGTPILGDVKYGADRAVIDAPGIVRRLHLHAARLELPHPAKDAHRLRLFAPPPPHFEATVATLGLEMPRDAPSRSR
ncbi:RluA family pseudouridine synthase [Vineibacter terrae]|uniref:RluA family pseudouridine synthase n=1 Tax=Vineibacter terrae TaxID=2586908 RepID=UPI001E391EAF|nr:RluA family pseudouridine synthase [Vineibacter terrae]